MKAKEKIKKESLIRLGPIFETDSFSVQSQSGHILIDSANGGGGLFLLLVQKSVLKC